MTTVRTAGQHWPGAAHPDLLVDLCMYRSVSKQGNCIRQTRTHILDCRCYLGAAFASGAAKPKAERSAEEAEVQNQDCIVVFLSNLKSTREQKSLYSHLELRMLENLLC